MGVVDSGVVALCVPAVYLLGAAAAVLAKGSVSGRWRVAQFVASVAMVVTVLAAAIRLWEAGGGAGRSLVRTGALVAVDPVAAIMLALATVLGWVIVRFSRTYLEGEAHQQRYIVAVLGILAGVSIVAISNHLGLLVLGWMATSVSLHRLLMFYQQRPWAVVAAHKKFLVSRLAEACLACVLLLLFSATGSLSISAIASAVQGLETAPAAIQAAAVLLALAVILKSAQLPMHGWLIQVMEAPTPVSALLHAGVVNLGGFVLIRLAPLVSAVPAAQVLLVVVGGLTAVLAGLVMTTRISIKVKLAWSTCAQMGFMLVECGLGLYELALLHLVAHSIYKAHAFLTAAGVVTHTRQQSQAPRRASPSFASQWVGAAASIALVAMSARGWTQVWAAAHLQPALVAIAGVGLAPFAASLWSDRWSDGVRGALRLVLLAQLPVIWHLLLSVAPVLDVRPGGSAWLPWAAAGVVALFVVQSQLVASPGGWVSRTLYAWCYAGFYLDERFTRLTLRVWPLRMPPAYSATHARASVPATTGGAL